MASYMYVCMDMCVLHVSAWTENEKESFDWWRNWYPMTPVDYLDPTKPHPITLLGKNLVLWKDESGNWSCLEDVCSHRCACKVAAC